MKKEYIKVALTGHRACEDSPRAKYTDREVEYCFMLYEAGYSMSQVSAKLEIPYSTIYMWLTGMRRGGLVYKVPKKGTRDKGR